MRLARLTRWYDQTSFLLLKHSMSFGQIEHSSGIGALSGMLFKASK
jgi:hypothetical protein